MPKPRLEDLTEDLAEYGTPRQAEVLRTVLKHGYTRAARELNVGLRNVHLSVERLVAKAAKQGWSPGHDMTHTVPDGYMVKGTSTYYGEDGQMRAQWVKSNIDHERQIELLRELVDEITKSIPKAKKQTKIPKHTLEAMLNLYVITDYHLGMKAWGEETGADWDMNIAEELIYNWFDQAISAAPDSEVGIFCQLGDFTHFDSLEAVTPTSKHILDADTRAQLMARVAVRVYRRVMDKLLTKHQRVHVIVADANHDPMGAIWSREWLSAHYSEEPRVTIDPGADGYYCYEHGATSLFFHHGHKRKPSNIHDVFVAKFREVFGRTKHSYGHMGHLHHLESKETSLMVVEQHRTLAAPDAYAARGGFMSGRDAKVITYHDQFGEVSRLTISPELAGEHSG